MSDYDLRPGGSLKLKGGVADGGIVKKYALFPVYLQILTGLAGKRRSPNPKLILNEIVKQNASRSF